MTIARLESGTGIETKALTRDETRIMQRYVWTMPLTKAWKHTSAMRKVTTVATYKLLY
jgi:hypothetical protein